MLPKEGKIGEGVTAGKTAIASEVSNCARKKDTVNGNLEVESQVPIKREHRNAFPCF